jgi:hypothetical protein
MALQEPLHFTSIGQENILDRLIRARGLERFALFMLSGEGTTLPDGSEALSGYVVDPTGRVYSFWLGWDDEHREPALTEWAEEQPESDWLSNPEYRRAREALGLLHR